MASKVCCTPFRWLSAAIVYAVLLPSLSLASIGDQYEPDNTSATAPRFDVNQNALAQQHSFHDVDDEDWIVFYALPDTVYGVEATTLSANCDVAMTIYYLDGGTSFVLVEEVDNETSGIGEIFLRNSLPEGFYYVRFRNAVPQSSGPDVTYWLRVTIWVGAGLPIETVDDRTIGIRETNRSQGNARMVIPVLRPGDSPRRFYKQHSIEFPGYEETSPGLAIDVRIRAAIEAEAYNLPGQNFAPFSGALFVVETSQWSGGNQTPMAFTDRVNLVIEFQPDNRDVNWRDNVTFDGQLAPFDRMRAVRDLLGDASVNFQFIDFPQNLNLTSRTITIENFPNLTGSSGVATYGAVARLDDPPTTSAVRRWPFYP